MFQVEDFSKEITKYNVSIEELKIQEKKSLSAMGKPVIDLVNQYSLLKGKSVNSNHKIWTKYHLIEIYDREIRFYNIRSIFFIFVLFALLMASPKLLCDIGCATWGSVYFIKSKKAKRIQESLNILSNRMKNIIEKKINHIDYMEANREIFEEIGC